MIAIIDYGLGNVRAFANIYNQLNIASVIATSTEQLRAASRVILPGVGAFDQAMQRLHKSGMRTLLDEMVLQRRLPVLGVCVGMQILMQTSEEGRAAGLGWLRGEAAKFRQGDGEERMLVPHMGWNTVQPQTAAGLLAGIDERSRFYFLHSYFVRCAERGDVLAQTTYGAAFAAAVGRDNIYGVQFHPEKSHGDGIRLLSNFAKL